MTNLLFVILASKIMYMSQCDAWENGKKTQNSFLFIFQCPKFYKLKILQLVVTIVQSLALLFMIMSVVMKLTYF